MAECSFCGKEMPEGTGMMYVQKDATTYFFCSGKCEKNQLRLKRSRAKVKWTKKFLSEKEIRKG